MVVYAIKCVVDQGEFTKTVQPEIGFCDISQRVQRIVADSGIKTGVVNVQTTHTTTTLVLNENESGLLESDLPRALGRISLPGEDYKHDREERLRGLPDERKNAPSHLWSIVGGSPTLMLNVMDSTVDLGRWQRVLLFDCDRDRRPRTVSVCAMGE